MWRRTSSTAPGSPKTPNIKALSIFKGIIMPSPAAAAFIINMTAPPIRLFITSFSTTLSGHRNSLPNMKTNIIAPA